MLDCECVDCEKLMDSDMRSSQYLCIENANIQYLNEELANPYNLYKGQANTHVDAT